MRHEAIKKRDWLCESNPKLSYTTTDLAQDLTKLLNEPKQGRR